jgi:carbonic anhydrase/acetyltransferase-like protein (isoleucine patch superfamily)
MGAIIMDDAIVESGSVIAAGAVVLPGTIVESGSVFAGLPAKKVNEVSPELEKVFDMTAMNYIKYAEWYK